MGNFDDFPGIFIEENKMLRPFCKRRIPFGMPLSMRTPVDPVAQAFRLIRRYALRGLGAVLNRSICFIASEKETNRGDIFAADRTRPRTPAKSLITFGGM
jgi:hypothetical protein